MEILENAHLSSEAPFFIIHGRRMVGKTELISRFKSMPIELVEELKVKSEPLRKRYPGKNYTYSVF